MTETEMKKVALVKSILNPAIRSNVFTTVDFVKKTTGELRRMTLGRSKELEAGVKGTAPESRKYTLNERGMLVVEELTKDHKSQWRTIPLANVTRIKTGGVETVFD